MTKPTTPPAKPVRCKPDPKPTLDDFRTWYHQELRTSADLKVELAMARATIAAQAYTLAYRSRRTPDAGDDIPF